LSRKVKELICKELEERYRGTTSCVVVGYQGIDATLASKLRRSLREKDVELRVIRNRLAKIAFSRIGLDEVTKLFEGPVAIARGGEDPAALARAVFECAKETEFFVVKGGYCDGRLITADEVKALSEIPPKDVLYGKILGGVQAPIAKVAMGINGVMQKLAAALKALSEKDKAEQDNAGGQ